MKKGYYIVFGSQNSYGVNKKINMQLKEMQKLFDAMLIQEPKKDRSLIVRLIGLLPWVSNSYDYGHIIDKLKNPDYIYIRSILADKNYIKFLKYVREKYTNCKIIVEYPTFPYDKEWMIVYEFPFGIKDKLYRRRLHKYVDRIATYSFDDEIYGVPTLKIMNGIDVDLINIVHSQKNDDKIHLLGVAIMLNSHGYDRIIRGMYEYKKKGGNRVLVDLVGDGPKKQDYINLAKKLDVLDVVKFRPTLNGKLLDEVYEMADMTLIDFGAYRQGIYVTSALKSRESLAKGLPMVTACKIDVCEQVPFEYVLEYPNDGSDVDIFKIEKFYDEKIKTKGKLNVAREIRRYAKDNVDMSKTLKPVIDYINEVRR
jgi:hypothetical protein